MTRLRSRTSRRPDGVTAALWALAAAPVLWLLTFGLFILRTRLVLGAWPSPYQPDPKDLGFDVHYAVVLIGIPLMFAAVLTLVVLSALKARLALDVARRLTQGR